MSYEVILTDSFLKDLKKLKNKALEEQVLNKLLELEEYPERNKRLMYDLKDYNTNWKITSPIHNPRK